MNEINYALDREAVYETIANRLEEMILNDSTQIDQRLPSEQALAVSFGVSRPVIREALKLLKGRGLIAQWQGGRTVICEPGSKQLTDPLNRIVQLKNVDALQIFQIRLALELLSASCAAQKATADDIAALRAIGSEMRAAEQAGDLDRHIQCDLQFHRQIAQISGNPLLCLFIESIGELLREMFRIALHTARTGSDGINYHERLIRTLEMHDPQKAEQVMREHLTLSMRNYEFSLQQAGEKSTQDDIPFTE